MHPTITNTLKGGLNKDDSNFDIPPSDLREALNFRNNYGYPGKQGIGTNVKGTVKKNFNYNGVVHRCIGEIEDKQTQSLIYFLWAMDGNHKIMRYYLKTGVVENVFTFAFGWKRKTKIDNCDLQGDLLYWVDPKPRKINLSKANLNNKKKTWNIYMPISDSSSDNVALIVKNFATGATIVAPTVYITGQGEQRLQNLTNAINNNIGAYFTATTCDCKIELEETEVNKYDIVFGIVPKYFAVPENWYGKNPPSIFFNAIKSPPLYQPLVEYAQDEDVSINRVQEIAPQFRVRYYMDDNEVTVFGPISQIAVNNIVCNEGQVDAYNYIDVNINDERLLDARNWVLIKEAEIAVRLGNNGTFRAVERVDLCKLYDSDAAGSNPFMHYKFYNNILTRALSQVEQDTQYDRVPREAEAQAIVENRMVYGNTVQDYDGVDCAAADVALSINEAPQQVLYKVSGTIRILTHGLDDSEVDPGTNANFDSMFPTHKKYPFWDGYGDLLKRGGIFQDTNSDKGAFYGGGGYGTGGGQDFGITAGMEDRWDQRIPEGGWPVYVAGKPQYMTISRQIPVAGLATTGNGALDTSNQSNRDGIGAYLDPTLYPDINDLYSEFELKLPPGQYVIRLASHWCSWGDKLGKGAQYDLNNPQSIQSTSTNIWCIEEWNGTTQVFDAKKEFVVTVVDQDQYIGAFVVLDLAPPFDAAISDLQDAWTNITGYLMDSEGLIDPNDPDFIPEPVEKAIVTTNVQQWKASGLTDHNGYFYLFALANNGAIDIGALHNGGKLLRSTTGQFWEGYFKELYSHTLTPINTSDDCKNTTTHGFFATNGDIGYLECSTSIVGTAIDNNGHPIPGIVLVFTNGKSVVSDADGKFNLRCWGDSVEPNLSNFALINRPVSTDTSRTTDDILMYAGDFCQAIISGNPFNIPLSEIGANASVQTNTPPYSPTSVFSLGTITITLNGVEIYKTLKRGSNREAGVRYSDESGRLCVVSKCAEIYVPFETEDLYKFYPAQFPSANTYLPGIPEITITLKHKPPQWATTMQLMLTPNLSTFGELQWAINSVTYLLKTKFDEEPEVVTEYNNFNATHIKIDISNLIDYYKMNNKSVLANDYQIGDRIRLLATRDGVYYKNYYDFEIVNVEAPNYLIIEAFNDFELLSGTLIEIYKPTQLSEDRIYYEIGQAYPCTNPGQPNNDHSVSVITITAGDTYWRGRFIPVADEQTNYIATQTVFIEDGGISDFWKSTVSDIGRPGVVAFGFGEKRRLGDLVMSDPIIPDSKVNGLSSFTNIDDIVLSKVWGGIVKLVQSGQVLIVCLQHKAVAIYVSEVLAYEPETGGLKARTGDFLGNNRAFINDYSTQHPDSVRSKDGYVYGFDASRGIVWRYASNGFEEVSTLYKMRSYYSEYAKKSVWPKCSSFMDKEYNEYGLTVYETLSVNGTVVEVNGASVVLSISSNPLTIGDYVQLEFTNTKGQKVTYDTYVSDISGLNTTVVAEAHIPYLLVDSVIQVLYPGNGATNVFCEPKNMFSPSYSFLPEECGSIDKTLILFKNGELWVQDENAIRNNFFGVQYQTIIDVVMCGNGQPDLNEKVWYALMLRSKQDNGGCNWRGTASNENGQTTQLEGFELEEEFWHMAMPKDMNTPNVVDPILNGNDLRSAYIKVRLQNDHTGTVEIYDITAGYEYSYRNKP